MALASLYGHSLALLTDLYQLTMAQGYWKLGKMRDRAVFHLTFRRPPFASGYTIAAGLGPAIEYVSSFRFTGSDVAYLRTLRGNDGSPLFEEGFLDYLAALHLSCDVDAVPEGTAVFPHQPLVRVKGSLLECQLLETPLLNIVNFQTLIATKAARMCLAARGDDVIEFGLRRAQGIDGGLSAARAAYIGGCVGTSNVLAGKLYGIPVSGTHAHSWVMSFDTELESFEAYARAMPNNVVFLVDTFDTLSGVRHAVRVGKRLRDMGHDLAGVRLDSGDLAYLSVEARRILDDAGFTKTKIVASNELDEHIISSLKEQGATIAVWGVGTRLATAYDGGALGGVYKLSAMQRAGRDDWEHKIKLSEQSAKVTTPGILHVRRFWRNDQMVGDMLYDELIGAPADATIVDPMDPTRGKRLDQGATWEELLVPVFRNGACVYQAPPLADSRARTAAQLGALHAGIKRLLNPHEYPAGMATNLQELKTALIKKARASLQRELQPTGGAS
jgi:nicotinate phosphoribosyltransferase